MFKDGLFCICTKIWQNLTSLCQGLSVFLIFLYFRELSSSIPKSYTSGDNLLLHLCLGDFVPKNNLLQACLPYH